MKLFSQRPVADFLLDQRTLVLEALRDPDHSPRGAALYARFQLIVPKLRTDQMNISDSGVVAVDTRVPEGLDAEAEVAYLAQLVERLEMPPQIWVTVRVPFEGEPVVFDLIPVAFDRAPPSASVVGTAIQLRTEHRHGSDAWKQQLEHDIENIAEHLAALEAPIGDFNQHVERLIRGAS
jgi:hypothetical protein